MRFARVSSSFSTYRAWNCYGISITAQRTTSSGWPEIDLRFCRRLPSFEYRTGRSDWALVSFRSGRVLKDTLRNELNFICAWPVVFSMASIVLFLYWTDGCDLSPYLLTIRGAQESIPSLAGQYDNPIFRTGPPSHIGWRNRFLGIDSWAP